MNGEGRKRPMIDCWTWMAGKSLIPGGYGDAHCEVSVEDCLLGHLRVLQSPFMLSVVFLLVLVEFSPFPKQVPHGVRVVVGGKHSAR
jgi:hypothetical protein